MKTLKLVFSIIVVVALTFNYSVAQPVQNDIVVTVDKLDYTLYAPGVGIVSGTYTYHFSYKLSKDGFIEAIHWNARDFNLTNNKGEKVKVIDSGHDNLGVLWGWFNTPDYYNGYNPGIQYSTEENWLDGLMPATMPSEGVAVEMSCKIFCKSGTFRIPFLAILHINANGVETVNVVKP